ALEEQVHDGRVGRGTRLGDEVPLGVVTTRQEREVRVLHNVELARDRVAVRDVAGLPVGTHTRDDLTRGDGLDLLGGELQRRGNDERVTRGDANSVAVLVRLLSDLLEGSLQRRDRQRAVGRASRQVAVLGREVDVRDRKSTRLNSSHGKSSYAGFS